MARDIFRREAMEAMASPDRLDQPLRLVRPAMWLFLGLGGAVILFALVWGLIVRVPIETQAQGILIDSAGIAEVSSQYEGRVVELAVAPGTQVEAGEVVARLSRRTRDRDIAEAQAALADAERRAGEAEQVFRANEGSIGSSERALAANLVTRMAEVRRQLAAREETVANIRRLVDQNAATREELAGVTALADELRTQLRQLEQQRLDQQVAVAQRGNDRRTARLAESQQVAEARRALAQLVAQAGDEEVIVAPISGELVELRAAQGDVIGAGEVVAVIDPRSSTERAQGGVEAVFYAPPASGKRIEPGMAVEVVPTTAEREIYGFIRGEVIEVAPYPASREAMVRVLRNDQLAAELAASGSPLQVRVRLESAPGSASGFAWSSSEGPGWPITRGTPLSGTVVLERRPFLEVLLPGIFGRAR
ncbi:MAG: NHLP bacteriocin system secretion protein [Erythrobacter sp.]|nr:NHLP bacteriocin system secretion protein [Erythrobacter sp.]